MRLGTKRAAHPSSASPSRRTRTTSQKNFPQDSSTGFRDVPSYEPRNQAMPDNRAYSSTQPPPLSSSSVQLPVPDLSVPRPNLNASRFTPSIPFPSSSVTPRTANRHISAFLGLTPTTTDTENTWERPLDYATHQKDYTQSTTVSNTLPPPWPVQHSDTLPPASNLTARSNTSNERTHYSAGIIAMPQTTQNTNREDHEHSDHVSRTKLSPEFERSKNLKSSARAVLPPPLETESSENGDTHNISAASLPTPSALTSFLNMDLFTPRTSEAPATSNAQYILPSPSNSSMFPMTPRGMSFDALLSTPSMRNTGP